MSQQIRNFCIIAHIDHGKSTLADRFLELTNTVEKRKMRDQLLDQMELEQERGITIKLQPVRMEYKGYELNLIDTPGHVDFSYEVSRSLAAVEGAILLVDASQGVQAQTIANLYLAIEQGLEIIPVMNKIDLPAAQPEKVAEEIINLLGCKREEILACSGKTGEGVLALLDQVITRVPAPKVDMDASPRALIFDSFYDDYKGVIAYVRVFDGHFKKGEKIKFMATKADSELLDVGMLKPQLVLTQSLNAGEIGYMVTGLKNIHDCRVGDTVTLQKSVDVQALAGYKEVKPMVYAGVFCREGNEYSELREAIDRLKLNDAGLMIEPENSAVLGFGFRCGFLGLLHLEIFTERLRREYNLDLVITAPSVAFRVIQKPGTSLNPRIQSEQRIDDHSFIMKNPNEYPDPGVIEEILEPIMKLDIVTPKDYIGNVMTLVQDHRGQYLTTEFMGENRVLLHYYMPLAMVIVDFYDKLKSVSSGFASMNYEFHEYRPADVLKMVILVAEDPVEALSTIVYRDSAFDTGKKIVGALKDTIHRQQFVIKLQAAIGGKVIASERITALRKDVTAGLYGGDYSRRKKLLEKQKKGKKKMMAVGKGKVNIPQEAFLAVMKR